MGLFILFTLFRSSFVLSFLNDKGDSDINELVSGGKEKCHQSPGHQFLIVTRGRDPRWMTPEKGKSSPRPPDAKSRLVGKDPDAGKD